MLLKIFSLLSEIKIGQEISKNFLKLVSSRRKKCERDGEKKLHIELHFNKNTN